MAHVVVHAVVHPDFDSAYPSARCDAVVHAVVHALLCTLWCMRCCVRCGTQRLCGRCILTPLVVAHARAAVHAVVHSAFLIFRFSATVQLDWRCNDVEASPSSAFLRRMWFVYLSQQRVVLGSQASVAIV